MWKQSYTILAMVLIGVIPSASADDGDYWIEGGISYGWASSDNVVFDGSELIWPYPTNIQDLNLGPGAIDCRTPCAYFARTRDFQSTVDLTNSGGTFHESYGLSLGLRKEIGKKTDMKYLEVVAS